MNAGAPGCGGIGLHYPGAAQDRNSAQYAKTSVGGFLGNLFTAGNRDFHRDALIRHQTVGGPGLQNRFCNHAAGHSCNRWPADLDAGTGHGNRAYAGAAPDAHGSRGLRVEGYGATNFGTVGNVRVVATVLDDRAEHAPVGNVPLATVYLEFDVPPDR